MSRKTMEDLMERIEDIESVPVVENEEYKFDYDIKRGVTMEFFR